MRIDYGFTARRSIFRQTSAQVFIGAALIAAQSLLLTAASYSAQTHSGLIYNTAIGCFFASTAGIAFVKGISQYPGVEESSNIAPSFFLSYSILLIVFVLGRFEYSRILLVSSFLVNLVFFMALYLTLRRSVKLRIGIVPHGEYSELLTVGFIEWRILNDAGADVTDLDAISVDLRSDVNDEWERRLARFALQGLPVYHAKHLLESLTGKVQIEHLSENSFGTLTPLSAYMNFKRVADILTAIVALLALAPLLLVVALCIVFDSRGPVLFRQVRIGYQGRPFRVFKFRTMTVAPDQEKLDLSEALEAAKTKEGDQRITRVGSILRRSRLDELPQLLNIIEGDMSWIGPRPEAQVLSFWYEDEIPFYNYRHIVRPGITGWAQVNQGHVAEVSDVKDKLNFDFYYIKNFSPWIDLLIIGRTIRTVLTGFGSR